MCTKNRLFIVALMVISFHVSFFNQAQGLVFSLNPISNDHNTIKNPLLPGRWSLKSFLVFGGEPFENNDPDFEVTCEIKERGAGYVVEMDLGNELELEFEARLVRYWGESWLELRPSTDSFFEFLEEGFLHPLLVMELYYVFKVEEIGKEMILSVMDPKWTLERLQTSARDMKFVSRELLDGYLKRIYLTSEPHELRDFFARASMFREALPYGIRLKRVIEE